VLGETPLAIFLIANNFFTINRRARRRYSLQANAGLQRQSGYLEGVCQYLIPKYMSGPAHFIQFQASPALFPVSFTAITKDELSSLRKHVFSQTRYVDCVCTFTFSNKVLCQHKFYVFFNVRIIWLQSRWDFQCQDSTQATCVSGEEEEPVPCLWMSGYFLAKNLKTFLKSHHNSSDKKKQNKTKKNTTQI